MKRRLLLTIMVVGALTFWGSYIAMADDSSTYYCDKYGTLYVLDVCAFCHQQGMKGNQDCHLCHDPEGNLRVGDKVAVFMPDCPLDVSLDKCYAEGCHKGGMKSEQLDCGRCHGPGGKRDAHVAHIIAGHNTDTTYHGLICGDCH